MHRFGLGLWVAAILAAAPAVAGQPLEAALFALNEMDMHLHAGMEREVPMDEWLDLAVADGRKVVVLLDHLELYRKTPAEYEAWRTDRGFHARYPVGAEGHKALFASFHEAAAARDDLIIFTGWEIYEGELDTGFEAEPMQRADVIGWHISPNNGREAPDGATLIKRARQAMAAQAQFPVPMILFHPFSMRFENLQRTAQREGRDPATITAEEYRFFTPEQHAAFIELVRGSSVYLEISSANTKYWDNPACREALIADVRPLAEAGVQFTVSTDNHGVGSAKTPFNPEKYGTDIGLTPANTNGIVRELLALRAKRNVQQED